MASGSTAPCFFIHFSTESRAGSGELKLIPWVLEDVVSRTTRYTSHLGSLEDNHTLKT